MTDMHRADLLRTITNGLVLFGLGVWQEWSIFELTIAFLLQSLVMTVFQFTREFRTHPVGAVLDSGWLIMVLGGSYLLVGYATERLVTTPPDLTPALAGTLFLVCIFFVAQELTKPAARTWQELRLTRALIVRRTTLIAAISLLVTIALEVLDQNVALFVFVVKLYGHVESILAGGMMKKS